MSVETQLAEVIEERVGKAPLPVPDLDRVRKHGSRLRNRHKRRRVGMAATVGVAACGAVVLTQTVMRVDDFNPAPEPQRFAAVGPLDFSEGARAFASPDPDGRISLGGRYFPRKHMTYLDTSATATPYGLVFFDRAGQAHLLGENGKDTVLAPAPTVVVPGLYPSSKADARLPLVAFTQARPDGVAVVLRDMESGRTIATRLVQCTGGDCTDVTVEAVDHGLVFVRTSTGTFVWDPEADDADQWTSLGEGEFRVADARNGRILWSYAPPSPAPNSPVADWAFTKGKIDAELSLDGNHVLYWGPRLKPTTPEGTPIVLDVEGAIWFTFDTDGSVLAAANGRDMTGVFYDCVIPSGSCEHIGTVSTTSGDPVFIGSDM